MKYLIVKCKPLNDQWESDAHRTPMFLVDDWKQWAQTRKSKFYFEVYEIRGNSLKLVKDWEDD